MKKDVVIKVEKISKKYSIGRRESYLTLRDKLMELPGRLLKRQKPKEFWALKDISFEVKRGEVVGIIGRNGAGKSTLLKILARITEPTSGSVTMKGRVASMLEVGTGFNPELTGRENIYLNGAILGMTRKEIESKFKEIHDFSGIGEFIDTPVKHFSSGMYTRLAFSVAAHLDAEILLVDEVLAVGDLEFQKKCLGKIDEIARSNRTVIFVSHNLKILTEICDVAIYLEKGKIMELGPTPRVSRVFLKSTLENRKNYNQIQFPKNNIGSIIAVRLLQEGKIIDNFEVDSSKDLILEIETNVKKEKIGLRVYVDLCNFEDLLILRSFNDSYINHAKLKQGRSTLQVSFPKLLFLSQEYYLKIFLTIHNVQTLNPEGILIPLKIIQDSKTKTRYSDEKEKGLISPLNISWLIKD